MPTDFPPSRAEIFETFEELQDWDERYEFILDLGRELPALDVAHHTQENKVHGCMSTVWLVAQGRLANIGGVNETIVHLEADSDSLIVKGLIVILLSLFCDRTPQEIVEQDPTEVFSRLGLSQHLSPSRRNGLFSMVKRIRQLSVEIQASADGNGR